MEALAAAAAAAAVATERVVYRTTHAFPLAHARKLHTYASTHAAEVRTARRLLEAAAAAAAADRPNSSSSSSTQRRRRCGSGGGSYERASFSSSVSMTPCLGGCVFTYASARGVLCAHTKVNESLSILHTAEEATTTAQRLFAAAADRPNSSSSSTQQRRRRGSGGGQLRASEPLIVRLMTPCMGGCALFRSVTCTPCCFHKKMRNVS